MALPDPLRLGAVFKRGPQAFPGMEIPMKVRMLVHMSGTRNGQEWPPAGVPMDLPDLEAEHYIAGGIAEAVVGEPETAVAVPAETSETPAAEVSQPPAPAKRAVGRPRKNS